MNNSAELLRQYNIAKKTGWLSVFKEEPYGVPASLLLAIASRESNMGKALAPDGTGDHHNGFGLMQIDRRHFPAFCSGPKATVPEDNIKMGAFVWQSKYNAIRAKGIIPIGDIKKIATSAYNCSVEHALAGYFKGDSDLYTTGKNYAADVLAREKVFVKLLTSEV